MQRIKASAADHLPHSPPRVPQCLIVDDEPGIRAVISRTLGGYGLTADEFADAEDAVTSIANGQPKIIFLDVSLARSDAIEAIRGFAQRKFSGAVQLISGHKACVVDEIRKIGERHGLRMREPIAKPFAADAIRTVVIEEALTATVLSEHPIPLDEALRNGWLELWYQPKIDLQKRTLVGAEALARVRHPEHGLVAPKAFLPHASQAELSELTTFVIKTALRDWSVFAASGANLKLAVNVTASTLGELPLAQLIRDNRPDDGNWPGLILEVVEDAFLHDLTLIHEVATQLSLYNVSLSIDDFGSGHSSMKRLRDLPCAELKLDHSFVRDCAENGRNARICEAVIKLAHELGIAVTAEGIERSSELRALRAMGCDIGQGFLFSPPVERDSLLAAAQERPRIISSSSTPRSKQEHDASAQ